MMQKKKENQMPKKIYEFFHITESNWNIGQNLISESFMASPSGLLWSKVQASYL